MNLKTKDGKELSCHLLELKLNIEKKFSKAFGVKPYGGISDTHNDEYSGMHCLYSTFGDLFMACNTIAGIKLYYQFNK